nr:hypothetical protein [Desulfobacterales bacterium]
MKFMIARSLLLLMVIVLSVSNLWARGAISPDAAYRQYIGALYRADPDQALVVIAGRPDQIEFIRSFISFVRARNAFRENYIAA